MLNSSDRGNERALTTDESVSSGHPRAVSATYSRWRRLSAECGVIVAPVDGSV